MYRLKHSQLTSVPLSPFSPMAPGLPFLPGSPGSPWAITWPERNSHMTREKQSHNQRETDTWQKKNFISYIFKVIHVYISWLGGASFETWKLMLLLARHVVHNKNFPKEDMSLIRGHLQGRKLTKTLHFHPLENTTVPSGPYSCTSGILSGGCTVLEILVENSELGVGSQGHSPSVFNSFP